MNLIPVKTPQWIKGIFPNYIWNMPNDQKVIYLTFDDGPTPEVTTWTLDLLKSYNAKATFFCIGNNVEQHPHLFHNILNEGHVIGNHTYNHPRGWYTATEAYIDEIVKTQKIIEREVQNAKLQSAKGEALQTTPSTAITQSLKCKLFRPPYGQIRTRQGTHLLGLGYKIIMWDILAFDWKTATGKESCSKNVISKAGPGSIVVFHDSVKAAPQMRYALEETLAHFSKLGYRFKSLEF